MKYIRKLVCFARYTEHTNIRYEDHTHGMHYIPYVDGMQYIHYHMACITYLLYIHCKVCNTYICYGMHYILSSPHVAPSMQPLLYTPHHDICKSTLTYVHATYNSVHVCSHVNFIKLQASLFIHHPSPSDLYRESIKET